MPVGVAGRFLGLTFRAVVSVRRISTSVEGDGHGNDGHADRRFYSPHRGTLTELSADTVSALLKQAGTTARAQCPSRPDHIYRHMLRKTKAMNLYQEGIPMPVIMRLLGHENTPPQRRSWTGFRPFTVSWPATLIRGIHEQPPPLQAIPTNPRLNANLGIIAVKPNSA